MEKAHRIDGLPLSGSEFEQLSIEFHRQMTRLARWLVATAWAGSVVLAVLLSAAFATLA
jgi:hypothetical protein